MAYVIEEIIKKRRPRAKILMIGFSSGSGLVAKFMGEYSDLCASGIGICPGYNIEYCMGRFAEPYQSLLLSLGNNFFLEQNKKLLEGTEGYEQCKSARNLQDWLSKAHAMAGYASARDYYNFCNPMNTVHGISKPCLFINSEDDPLCVLENVTENLDSVRKSEHCVVCVTKTGSHLPFYEGIFFKNWAAEASYEFFDAVLSMDEGDDRIPIDSPNLQKSHADI